MRGCQAKRVMTFIMLYQRRLQLIPRRCPVEFDTRIAFCHIRRDIDIYSGRIIHKRFTHQDTIWTINKGVRIGNTQIPHELTIVRLTCSVILKYPDIHMMDGVLIVITWYVADISTSHLGALGRIYLYLEEWALFHIGSIGVGILTATRPTEQHQHAAQPPSDMFMPNFHLLFLLLLE